VALYRRTRRGLAGDLDRARLGGIAAEIALVLERREMRMEGEESPTASPISRMLGG
jgi:hypothetical protein